MYFKFEFPNTDGGKQILMWILETGMEKQKKVHKYKNVLTNTVHSSCPI